MYFAGDDTGAVREPRLGTQIVGWKPRSPRESGAKGREPDLWPPSASPCLGDLWRSRAQPARSLVLPFHIFWTPPSISGRFRPPWPAQRLHFGRTKSETHRGWAEGAAERSAWLLPWKSAAASRAATTRREPGPQLPAQVRGPPARRSQDLPFHTCAELSDSPGPGNPSKAGPQPPGQMRSAPSACSSFLRFQAERAKGSSSALRPQLRLPEGHGALPGARPHLRQPLTRVLSAEPLEDEMLGEGRSSGFWKPASFALGAPRTHTLRPDDFHPGTSLGAGEGSGLGAGAVVGEEPAALSCGHSAVCRSWLGAAGPVAPSGLGSGLLRLCLRQITHARALTHTHSLSDASGPMPRAGTRRSETLSTLLQGLKRPDGDGSRGSRLSSEVCNILEGPQFPIASKVWLLRFRSPGRRFKLQGAGMVEGALKIEPAPPFALRAENWPAPLASCQQPGVRGREAGPPGVAAPARAGRGVTAATTPRVGQGMESPNRLRRERGGVEAREVEEELRGREG